MSDYAAVKAKELVRDLREGFEGNLERARLTTNSVTGLEAVASAARMRIDDLESSIAAVLRDARVKEAEWCLALIRSHEEEYLSKLQQRIAQLKRGEL